MEETLTAMEQIHNDVFEFLLEKHFEEKKTGNDFFFKTRQRFSRGKEKLWFLGNDDYAAISFWTGTNYQNKTPNIYLEIHIDGRVALFVVGKGDEEQKRFLSVLANKSSEYQVLNLNALDNGVWTKTYTDGHNGEYLKYLKEFLDGDKKMIEYYLLAQEELNNMLDEDVATNAATTAIIDNNLAQQDDEIEYSETYPRRLSAEEFYKMLTGVMDRKYETRDYFFGKPAQYPLRGLVLGIKSFEVRNYNGIEHLKIDGIQLDTKWIVLTGENGFGKSSVLQSIAIGLCGNTDGSYQLLDDNGFVMLEGQKGNEQFLNLSFNFNTKNAFVSIKEKIAVYGAMRLNAVTYPSPSDNFNSRFNLFSNNGIVNIENQLTQSYAYNRQRFELLKEAFRKLIPDLKDVTVDTINGEGVVRYWEHEANKSVSFNELASGFKNIIAIVGDIITRLSNENSGLQSVSYLNGIVIIDEFELHLHPKYQKSLPKKLTEIFPNILFIVSTHSPIPLLGMPKETVLLHVNRTKEEGIIIERLDVDFTNLLPNAILTSPIFGFQEIVPVSNGLSKSIRTEADYTEVLFNTVLEKKVEEIKNKYKKG